jgi:hypothetical protein
MIKVVSVEDVGRLPPGRLEFINACTGAMFEPSEDGIRCMAIRAAELLLDRHVVPSCETQAGLVAGTFEIFYTHFGTGLRALGFGMARADAGIKAISLCLR